MRTLEATHISPNLGAGTSENVVPEGLRKLGRLAVWAMAGAQFVDLIWCESEEGAGDDRPAASPRRKRLSHAEFADLISSATRRNSAGTPSC
jgi:hypothetical protein